jgi:hypothetical protein
MVTFLLLVVVVVLAVLLARQRRREDAIRSDLTEKMGDFRAERDAAIRAVRWVPMKDEDLVKLAKTGCNTCHGAGHYMFTDKANDRKTKAVCKCVVIRMANDPKYAFAGDGIPVRIATQAELDAILPNERSEKTAADVIPIGGVH